MVKLKKNRKKRRWWIFLLILVALGLIVFFVLKYTNIAQTLFEEASITPSSSSDLTGLGGPSSSGVTN